MKDKIFEVLQRIGRSFMLPIAILPVAGLLLGLGETAPQAMNETAPAPAVEEEIQFSPAEQSLQSSARM